MTKTLIVDQANEYIDLHLVPEDARIHSLIPVVVIAMFNKFRTKVLNDIIVFILLERFGGLELALERAGLASETFNQHAHCHS